MRKRLRTVVPEQKGEIRHASHSGSQNLEWPDRSLVCALTLPDLNAALINSGSKRSIRNRVSVAESAFWMERDGCGAREREKSEPSASSCTRSRRAPSSSCVFNTVSVSTQTAAKPRRHMTTSRTWWMKTCAPRALMSSTARRRVSR